MIHRHLSQFFEKRKSNSNDFITLTKIGTNVCRYRISILQVVGLAACLSVDLLAHAPELNFLACLAAYLNHHFEVQLLC